MAIEPKAQGAPQVGETVGDPEVLDRIAQSHGRISRIETQGPFIWVKRKETLTLRMRLQKGDTAAAFEGERAALHKLSALGAPVPEIVAEGPDFFATRDSGISLDHLMRDAIETGTPHETEFAKAAEALAGLHGRHLTHGHPRIKDICWDGDRITFIDLERYRDSLNTPFGHARDVVTFFFSSLAVAGRRTPEVDAARIAYLARDADGNFEGARRLARRLRFMGWLSAPLRLRREGKAREFKAIPMTLDFFEAT